MNNYSKRRINHLQQSNVAHWKDVLNQLVEVDLPREQKRLTDATAEGDLSENAEFEDAKNQVEVIEARIEEVKALIKKLEASEKTKKTK